MSARTVRVFLLMAAWLVAAAAKAATLDVAPTSVPQASSVTATWSAIATPTSTDWIALATPGSANTSYISWRYTTGTASGNVPFTIPTTVAPGTYLLRLFAANGYTLLAASGNFTVGLSLGGTITANGAPLANVAFAATNGGACGSSDGS